MDQIPIPTSAMVPTAAATTIPAAKRALRTLVKNTLKNLSDENIAAQSQKCTSLLLSLPEYRSSRRISIYLSMPHRELQTRNIVEDAFHQGKRLFIPFIHRNNPLSPALTIALPTSKLESGSSSEIAGYAPKNIMDMRYLPSLKALDSLERDSWGIPSLPADADREDSQFWDCLSPPGSPTSSGDGNEGADKLGVDLVILPGVAFGVDGRRLGHGKGYYDFWLERYRRAVVAAEGKNAKMPVLVGTALAEQVFEEGRVPVDERDWLVDVVVTGDGKVVRRPKGNASATNE